MPKKDPDLDLKIKDAVKAFAGKDYLRVIQGCRENLSPCADLSREHCRILMAAFNRLERGLRNTEGRVVDLTKLVRVAIHDELSDYLRLKTTFCGMLKLESERQGHLQAAVTA